MFAPLFFTLLATAFPGAEGAGANAKGGRGGDVYHVTNLRDSGPGSLRQGVTSATGPRTIVFDVAGTIQLASALSINKPNLTLAGQTAPGGGITVAGFTVRVINTSHVIIRYMRFRAGDTNCPRFQDDALQVDKSTDVILDHVSSSWSVDETLSVTESAKVTVQWSIIAESMNNSCHEKGEHGYGTLLRYGPGDVTMHHNLWAHHRSRNPRLGDDIFLDFVNNVIYNHGGEGGYSGADEEGSPRLNYIGNYIVAGPSTAASRRARAFLGGGVKTRIFAAGNLIDGNVNGRLDGADTGWAMIQGQYTRIERLPGLAEEPAAQAYEKILSHAGASLVRDAVDERILRHVAANEGKLIDSQNDVGGYPALAAGTPPADTDGDGIPDAWERARGLDPANPADGVASTPNGYTNLEIYLDALTRPRPAPTSATLVDDTFADAESATQDLKAGSLQWFNGRAVTVRRHETGATTFDMTAVGGSSEAFWAYFTDGPPVELGIGDRLTVAVTFALQGFRANAQDIRWGILDSKRTRNRASLGGGQNDATFIGDTGYGVQFYPSGNGSPFVLGRRANLTGGNPFNNFGDFATIAGTGATARQALTDGVPYTFTHTLERLDEQRLRTSVAVTGGSLSGLEWSGIESSAQPEATFDYFTFRIGGTNFADAIRFTRALVEYVPSAPIITQQPQPSRLTVQVGGAVTLVAAAAGREFVAEWYKDDLATGITGPVLSLPSVTPADAGRYTLVVTNAGGSATSDPVVLSVSTTPVAPPPVIVTPPGDASIVRGRSVTLMVEARGDALVYQWFRNGSPLAGAAAASLTLGAANVDDAGNYTVLVSNSSGSVMSAPGRLTVVSPMVATTVSPHPGADGLCVDAPLSITFDLAPRLGRTGRIVVTNDKGDIVDTIAPGVSPQTRLIGGQPFNYRPLIVEGNTVRIYLHNPLPAAGRYTIHIEPGVFEDELRAPYTGLPAGLWYLTTRALPPAGLREIAVAADHTGDFCTVQGAIDHVPAGNARPVTIALRPFTYTEIVSLPANKPFVTIRGDDRERTVIAYENNSNLNPSTATRPLLGIEASDVRLENLTLWNTTPKGGSQAEALRTNGRRILVDRVTLKSFQDTLLLNTGSAFVNESYIEGDVDFLWGGAAGYFRNCEIRAVTSGSVYTQVRNGQGQNGFVFVGSRLTAPAGVGGAYLSRIDPTVFPFSQVVFLDTAMGPHIRPDAWQLNNANAAPTIQFWEFGSTDLEGKALDVSARPAFSRQLTAAEAARWRDPAFVLGGWNPLAPL